MKLIDKGDGDFDVEDGAITIELSRRQDGGWHFWNVRIGPDRFGGSQIIGPGSFAEWLKAETAIEPVDA